nr:AP-3 complex subunit mu [Ipomoea batatas]
MLQCIFLLSDSGEVMLEKQLTGHRVDRSICDWFVEQSISQGDSFKHLPVIASPTHYLFQVVREGITFLASTQVEMPPLMAIEIRFFSLPPLSKMIRCFIAKGEIQVFLEVGVADIFSDYLGGLNEDLVKDNFVIAYELLDEMIDNGFPLTTEPNILREMIAPPNIVSKMLSVVTGSSSNVSNTLPGATATCVPWRKTDLKHTSNEVYVNLVEEMDAIINKVKKLKSTPIYVKPQLSSDSGTCRISLLVGIKNDPGKPIDDVSVQFQLPNCVLSADLSSNLGTVNILTDKTCCWSIGRIPKDKSPSLSGTLVLESGLKRLHVFPTFRVGFKIMGTALSGLKIDKLDIRNLPTCPYKGFRALTRAGEYQVNAFLMGVSTSVTDAVNAPSPCFAQFHVISSQVASRRPLLPLHFSTP